MELCTGYIELQEKSQLRIQFTHMSIPCFDSHFISGCICCMMCYAVGRDDCCSILLTVTLQKEDTDKKRKSTSKTGPAPAVGFHK